MATFSSIKTTDAQDAALASADIDPRFMVARQTDDGSLHVYASRDYVMVLYVIHPDGSGSKELAAIDGWSKPRTLDGDNDADNDAWDIADDDADDEA